MDFFFLNLAFRQVGEKINAKTEKRIRCKPHDPIYYNMLRYQGKTIHCPSIINGVVITEMYRR